MAGTKPSPHDNLATPPPRLLPTPLPPFNHNPTPSPPPHPHPTTQDPHPDGWNDASTMCLGHRGRVTQFKEEPPQPGDVRHEELMLANGPGGWAFAGRGCWGGVQGCGWGRRLGAGARQMGRSRGCGDGGAWAPPARRQPRRALRPPGRESLED